MGQGSEAAKGALGGAATGAAVGSVVPGIGTAIGAVGGGVIGGLAGWFGGKDKKPEQRTYQDRDQMLALIKGGMGAQDQGWWSRDVTQMTPAQSYAAQMQMGDDPFRRAQLQQVGQLQGIASGQQQGAGELAVQRQMQNALAAQQAQARMARGGNAALAYRGAANQSAALGSTAAGMGQQAALGDQMQAQGMLGGLSAQGRSGDINVAGQNAGFQQQTGLANMEAQQQIQQANSNNYLRLIDQLSGMNSAQMGNQAPVSTQPGIGSQLLSTGGQALGAYMQSRGK